MYKRYVLMHGPRGSAAPEVTTSFDTVDEADDYLQTLRHDPRYDGHQLIAIDGATLEHVAGVIAYDRPN